jgi:bifunctional aspartokinase / homoserine dehydrogenase 1
MKVLKFCGSSVGSSAAMQKVFEIAKKAVETEKCVVVLSAMQGVTDSLIEIGNLAAKGDEGFREQIKLLETKHFTAIRELLPIANQSGVLSAVKIRLNELENLCEGIFLLQELSARTLDRIVSFGELLSSTIISAKFSAENIANVWRDTRELIKTDSNFGFAAVNFPATDKLISDFVNHNSLPLFIVGGFIASDVNDVTTTLGRGGSDYSASIFASALDADCLEIWTDVSGMMTADPRFVKNAKAIPNISYKEAMELSHFGAKVIYPPTIQPVMAKNIKVWVKNTFAADDYGTLIESVSAEKTEIARGISSINQISLLTLEGSGMIGIPGFSKRLFDALSAAKINVILITQSSSEHSICVGVAEKDAETAKNSVDFEFEREISLGKLDALKVEKHLSILALVGDNMRNHQGISGKMFSALGHNGINIRAIAQGSSERNISAIIKSDDVKKAVNVIHEEFFETASKQINLFVAGVGNVGNKLLAQIEKQTDFLREKLKLSLRVVALANSKAIYFNEEGVSEAELQIPDSKFQIESGTSFEDLIIFKNLRNSIFVDVTANENIAASYESLLRKSVSVVACNKIAASSKYENYSRLKDVANEFSTSFLFETNVGAGLPIINTLNDLVRSGDEINAIQAVLSGTLNFVFNNYDGTRKFAEVVRQAQNEGYTEPDPRLDLSGTDVARKLLILIREAGNKLEIEDIHNESFLPESCYEGSVEDFYKQLEIHEEHFKKLFTQANADNRKLKYIASYKDGKPSVGLQNVDSKHDFYTLSGKDNAVLFYTNRYVEQPLVVKGAGAGAEVTASGVFADIIRVAKI